MPLQSMYEEGKCLVWRKEFSNANLILLIEECSWSGYASVLTMEVKSTVCCSAMEDNSSV